MKQGSKSLAIAAIFGLLFFASLAYVSKSDRLSPSDAMRLQKDQIIEGMETVFRDRSKIPDGDLTELAIASGVFIPKKGGGIFGDPGVNRIHEAMSRLDVKSSGIVNEFGGEVRVIGKNREIQIVYSNVPADLAQ